MPNCVSGHISDKVDWLQQLLQEHQQKGQYGTSKVALYANKSISSSKDLMVYLCANYRALLERYPEMAERVITLRVSIWQSFQDIRRNPRDQFSQMCVFMQQKVEGRFGPVAEFTIVKKVGQVYVFFTQVDEKTGKSHVSWLVQQVRDPIVNAKTMIIDRISSISQKLPNIRQMPSCVNSDLRLSSIKKTVETTVSPVLTQGVEKVRSDGFTKFAMDSTSHIYGSMKASYLEGSTEPMRQLVKVLVAPGA